MNKKVVIVGAGPGGLATAIELGNKGGFEIEILEAKQEISYKVCAGGISLKDFEKFGFPEYLCEIIKGSVGKTFDHYVIQAPLQRAVVKSDEQTAATLSRKKLHEDMAEEAQRLGAKICFNEKVIGIEGDSVITSSGHKYEFDYLVGADGSNSAVRKVLRLQKERSVMAIQYMIPISCLPDNCPEASEVLFFLDKKRFGVSYGWIFPQAGRISIGAGNYAGFSKFPTHELKERLGEWIEEKFGKGILEKAKYEGFPILFDYQGHEFGNIFLVGDAAGFANDLTGGGIIFSIVSGRYAAKKIADPGYDGREIEEILKRKENSRKLFRLMANPLIGSATVELFVFLLKFEFFRKRIGHELV